MVEQLAVNQRVVGSSPTSGAIFFVDALQQLTSPRVLKNGQLSEKLSGWWLTRSFLG